MSDIQIHAQTQKKHPLANENKSQYFATSHLLVITIRTCISLSHAKKQEFKILDQILPSFSLQNILLKISSIQCTTSKYTFITNVNHPLFFQSPTTNLSSLQMACRKRNKQNTHSFQKDRLYYSWQVRRSIKSSGLLTSRYKSEISLLNHCPLKINSYR